MSDAAGEDASDGIREWQRFLDAAVHDLRAVFRTVGTSAELLSQNCGETPKAREIVAMMREGVLRIDALSRGLGDYSRALYIDSRDSSVVPTATVLRAAIAELEIRIRDLGAEVRYGSLPKVRGSHERLTTLFRELLSNALAFRSTAAPRIEISVLEQAGQWEFAVRDNGRGIESKYWDKIFQPFQRLHANSGGPGLGLSVCKKIVEAHGGSIWVKSEPGSGSTFSFTLPGEALES
jgi:light-regulated signal transduction histidine kinase (bacteriophytochrome)